MPEPKPRFEPKTAVFVRRDLSPPQRAVQVFHAGVEMMLAAKYDETIRMWAERDKTVILFGVKDHAELVEWFERFKSIRIGKVEIPLFPFFEESMNGEMTAFAINPWFFGIVQDFGLELLD